MGRSTSESQQTAHWSRVTTRIPFACWTLLPFVAAIVFVLLGLYPQGRPERYTPLFLPWQGYLLALYVVGLGLLTTARRAYRATRSTENHWLRELIVSMAAISIALWMYKPWFCMLMNLGISVVSIAEYMRQRQIHRMHPIMIALLCYGLLQFVGLLWTPDMKIGLETVQTQAPFVLLPIVSMLFRPNRGEVKRFILTTLELLLLILVVCGVAYIITIAQTGNNFFDFLTIDKSFLLDRSDLFSYHLIQRWAQWIQPTYMSWVFLMILAMSYTLLRQKEVAKSFWISWGVYALLLFYFIFANQSRYGIICIPLFFGFIIIYEAYRRWGKRAKIWLAGLVVLGGIAAAVILNSNSTFFSDEARSEMLELGLSSINEHPITGRGTGGERELLRGVSSEYIYLHNDYLSAYVNHGVFGFVALLSLLITYAVGVYKERNAILAAFMTFTLLLMALDSIMISLPGVCIISLMLLMVHDGRS